MVEFNGYSKSEKAAVLQHSLRGAAAQILWDKGAESWTYKSLIKELKLRFGVDAVREKFTQELRSRRRRPGETLQKLETDIRSMLYRALGSEVQSHAGQLMGVDAFLQALDDPDLEVRIRDRDPVDLDDAVRLAVRLEAHTSLARRKEGTAASGNHARGSLTASVNKNTESGGVQPIGQDDQPKLSRTEKAKVRKMEQATQVQAVTGNTINLQKMQEQLNAQSSQIQELLNANAQGGSQTNNRARGGKSTRGRRGRGQQKGIGGSCFQCGQQGHFAKQCPVRVEMETAPQSSGPYQSGHQQAAY